jgi:opacity protein-like surface antigen
MKRTFALMLVLLAASAGTARAASLGVGAFTGMSFPIVQEDVSQGATFGLRFPVKLVPLFTLEPYWASCSLGDKDQDIGGFTYTREGFDETAFGLNAMLTTGGPVQFYPFVGIGSTRLERTGSDLSLTTYNAGLGLGIAPAPKLTLHLRGEFQMAVDGEASRKFGNVTVGASYALFSIP